MRLTPSGAFVGRARQPIERPAVAALFGDRSHLDLAWEHPVMRSTIETWSSVARLVRFDKRGTGLSDRPTGAATLEERTDDIRAVMDAVGLERAVVYGQSEGGQMACMFAAQYPERTTALVTWGAMARWRWTPDHPWGLKDEENEELLVELERNWPNEWYVRGPGAGMGPDADDRVCAPHTSAATRPPEMIFVAPRGLIWRGVDHRSLGGSMQIDQATRKAALEPLNVFVGEWSMEASFPLAAPASIAGRALVGRAVFEWMLGGQFLAQHEEIPDPDAPDS